MSFDFTSPLATPSATRATLERHNLHLKKSLGQNFLVNDDIISKIIQLADISPTDIILEVGPGIGTLTYALLSHASRVISIERDPTLPPVLADTLSKFKDRLTLVEKDALCVGSDDLCGLKPNKLVANLPYGVAATVVLDYFELFTSIDSMTVMVQREVAERMCAKPGTKEYGAYTIKLSLYAKPAGSFRVARSNFMPPPHVDSTVIKLDRHNVADADTVKLACMMADASFHARRKTITNSMRKYLSGRNKKLSERVGDILKSADIPPTVRGETLTTSDYLRLAEAAKTYSK